MITHAELMEMFDYQDGQLIRKKRIQKHPAGVPIGSISNGGKGRPDKKYLHTKIKGKHYAVHKLIYMYHKGVMPEQVDHINRDSLDNRIENLRAATAAENVCNRKVFSNNTSGHKGVSWHSRRGKWSVYVNADSKRKHIGYFDDLEFAALAADEARKHYHGAFACQL